MGKGLYSYTFKEEITLLTPFEYDQNEVYTSWDVKPDHIYTKVTYPNGFEYESKAYGDKVIIKSNKKLIDNKDGTVTVV